MLLPSPYRCLTSASLTLQKLSLTESYTLTNVLLQTGESDRTFTVRLLNIPGKQERPESDDPGESSHELRAVIGKP